MRDFISTVLLGLFFSLLVLVTADAEEESRPLYELHYSDTFDRSRVFRVLIDQDNDDAIESLEEYIGYRGRDLSIDEDGNPNIGILVTDIVGVEPTKRDPWSFKAEGTIGFSDFGLQACDASLADVEFGIDRWLKIGFFCPWRSRSMLVKLKHRGHVIWKRR